MSKSPDIPLFKEFKDKWNHIDAKKYQRLDKRTISEIERNEILNFVKGEIAKEKQPRADYLEFLELTILLLDENDNKYKIRPPGAMHQARWMARSIYTIKIFLLRSELKLSPSIRKSLQDICVFILKHYVKAWFQCTIPEKAPMQDLQLLKAFNSYKNKSISNAALEKLTAHLWYLSEEAVGLAFFDESISLLERIKMAENLSIEKIGFRKRYEILPSEINKEFLGEFYHLLVTSCNFLFSYYYYFNFAIRFRKKH